MTRKDNERQRLIRDRIIQGNRDDFAERQFEDAQIRMLIKLEKIFRIIFVTPVLIISVLMMHSLIQGLMMQFG